ncbi:hypothetical protein BKA61DRAFT_576353 [Leptodontidium sp. MPI-SDFR-AT-0119]|nr:hypothetical protein BKA61DRAFT_576353 [Leptodontidium sp. MPI-SDFR-AT-0119]
MLLKKRTPDLVVVAGWHQDNGVRSQEVRNPRLMFSHHQQQIKLTNPSSSPQPAVLECVPLSSQRSTSALPEALSFVAILDDHDDRRAELPQLFQKVVSRIPALQAFAAGTNTFLLISRGADSPIVIGTPISRVVVTVFGEIGMPIQAGNWGGREQNSAEKMAQKRQKTRPLQALEIMLERAKGYIPVNASTINQASLGWVCDGG